MRAQKKRKPKLMNFLSMKSKLAAVCSPVRTPHSTINAHRLNFRVRHVTGCIPVACAANNFISLNISSTYTFTAMKERTSFKIFSTSQLNTSQHLHFWPI